MELAKHTKANREFFATGQAPSVHDWVAWIRAGVVRGKVINGRPWVDLNHFAVNDILNPAPSRDSQSVRMTGLDLLS